MNKPPPDAYSSEANPIVPALEKLTQFFLLMFAAFSMFSISLTQIAFALGAISWLLKVHLTHTWKELKGTLVGIAILCFSLAYVLAVTASVDLESSFIHLKKLLQFIIFFWVINTVQSEKQRNSLITLIIVAGVITAFTGLSTYWGGLADLRPGWANGIRSVPATFAGTLMFTGLVALGRLLFNKPKEYWILGSLGVISFCLLFSMVRQAWLGCFIGIVFLIFFWNKKYLLLIPLLLACLLLLGPENIKNRILSFSNLKDNSVEQRVYTWKGGWKIFKDHPILGCGFKCVDSIHHQYPDPSGLIARYRGMHNNIFQLLVDTGIVGVGTWLAIWITYFFEVFKRWRVLAREKVQSNAAGILMGCSAAISAFLAGGFFETSIYDSEVAMLQYFLLGVSLAQTKELSSSNRY